MLTKRIKCSNCGREVSTEVPQETIIRAWIECPECLLLEPDNKDILENLKMMLKANKR